LQIINKKTGNQNPHGDFYTAPKKENENKKLFNELDEANSALREAGKDEQSQSAKSEGFFIVDLKQIDDMVQRGAIAEDVMAYMVLARGVNRRGELRVSTHGAQSIFKRTGMSYTKAEAAIQWLHEHNFIYKPKDEMQLGKGASKARTVKWVLHKGIDELDVALANALVEGIGRGKNNPPLMRIYTEASIGKHGFIADARLDALMVLVHLYRHHTFADCGGVNPRAGIYREWAAANNVSDEQVTDIPNSNAALYEIEGKNATVFTKFAAEALFYIDDVDERHIRFWDAFHTLTSLGFMYEVIQIWSANPNGSDKNARKAEPFYTLYVRDRHARESEPYLQRVIHNAAFRTGVMDTYLEFSYVMDDESDIKSGRFRYIATKANCGYPIGIYRLRFRPHTVDTGRGMAAEQSRVDGWAHSINKLN
jgi:hypothetical protein